GLGRNASSSWVRSRTVAASVETAACRRGSSASVEARECRPAAVSRSAPSRAEASICGSRRGLACGGGAIGASTPPADRPVSPMAAPSALLATRRSELVDVRRRRVRDHVDRDHVLVGLDGDLLDHRLEALLAPRAQPVLAGLEAGEREVPLLVGDAVV